MAKSIRVISLDFDGCLFNEYFLEVNQDVIEANKLFLEHIKSKNAKYSKNIVLIGSNRQSLSSDNQNTSWKRGSCFPRIQQVASYLKAKFDSFLLADLYSNQPAGTAYDHAMTKINIEEADYTQLEMEDKNKYTWLNDKSKLTLIYAQMHKLAAENPDKKIKFIFVDDRNDILLPLYNFFMHNREMIPSNVKLKLNCYAGPTNNNEAIPPSELVKECNSIQGNGKIDKNYRDSVKKIADKALRSAYANTIKNDPDQTTRDNKARLVRTLADAEKSNFHISPSLDCVTHYSAHLNRFGVRSYIAAGIVSLFTILLIPLGIYLLNQAYEIHNRNNIPNETFETAFHPAKLTGPLKLGEALETNHDSVYTLATRLGATPRLASVSEKDLGQQSTSGSQPVLQRSSDVEKGEAPTREIDIGAGVGSLDFN